MVSVGNLHWGGTGKTPLVAAIARHLAASGVRVAILSRGYGRSGHGALLVSRADGAPAVDARLAGDEPAWLARELPGVAVAVAERRAAAGRLCLERLAPPPELFLLDDGFSHLALARDLDLVVLPASDPFGGGRLPPSGRLREPLAAVARADAVLLVRAPGREPADPHAVAATLERCGFAGSLFTVDTEVAAPRDRQGAALEPDRAALLVTGVARPERVRASAEALGVRLLGHLALRDHEPYGKAILARIEERRRELGAEVVLTTGKDLVKLAGRLVAPLYELPVRAAPEAAFFPWLDRRLREIR